MAYGKNCACEGGFVPFSSAQEVWFWFMDAYSARSDGAQIMAGAGLYERPCDPLDILKIVERLYRDGILQRLHVKALRYFGEQRLLPDTSQRSERTLARFWNEAMMHLSGVFQVKGIICSETCSDMYQSKKGGV